MRVVKTKRHIIWLGLVASLAFRATAVAQQVPIAKASQIEAVQLKQQPLDGLSGVYQVRFSPDEQQLAVRGAVQQIDLWDWQRAELLLTMRGHEGRIRDLQFVCNGMYLASTTDYLGEPTRIWDLNTGKTAFTLPISGRFILPLSEASLGIVEGAKFHRVNLPPDDRQRTDLLTRRASARPLAAAPNGEHFLFWFANDSSLNLDYAVVDSAGRPVMLTHSGLNCEPGDAEFFSGVAGSQLAICCRREPTLQIKSLGPTEFRLTKRDIHDDSVSDLAVSPDGRWLATASWDGTVKIWELLTGKPIVQLTGHSDKVLCVDFSRSGRLLASGSTGSDNSVIVWPLFEALLGKQVALAASKTSPDRHWEQLGQRDPSMAYRSLAWFINHADEGLEILERQLASDVPTVAEEQFAAWLRDLSSDSYELRRDAYDRLLEHRDALLSQLEAALPTAGSLEMRLQLKRILSAEMPQKLLTAEQRNRKARAVFVLELIGGDTATNLLERMQDSTPTLQPHIQQALSRISANRRDT